MNKFTQNTTGYSRLLFILLLVFGFSTAANAQSLTINGQTTYQAFVGDSLALTYTFSGSDTAFTVAVYLDLDNDGAVSTTDYMLFRSQREEDLFVDGGFTDADGVRDGQVLIPVDEFFEVAPAQFILVATQENGATASALLVQEHRASNVEVSGTVSVPENQENLFVFVHPMYYDDMNNGSAQVHSTGLKKVAATKDSREFEKYLAKKANAIFAVQQDDNGNADAWCLNHDGPYENQGESHETTDGSPDDGGEEKEFFATLTDQNGDFSIPIPENSTMQQWMVGTFDEFDILSGYVAPGPIEFDVQNTPTNIDFQYIPSNSQVVGRVTDWNGNLLLDFFGNPLELEVYLWSDNGQGRELFARTNNGEYAIDVLPGNYDVNVDDVNGHYLRPQPQYVYVGEQDTVIVNFTLLELDSHIAGHVFIRDEGPFVCARLEAKSPDGGWAEGWSDENGYFWIPVSSQANSWEVWLDQWSLPGDLMVAGDPSRFVAAGTDTINFELVRREMPTSEPTILSIHDIPADQGKQVRVVFGASAGDWVDEYGNSWGEEIKAYHVWRRGPKLPDDAGGESIEYNGQVIPRVANLQDALGKGVGTGDRVFVEEGKWIWDYIVTIPAVREPYYAFVAPTLHDSTAFNPAWTHFRVSAQSSWSQNNWYSLPDSGYSVDNLFPRFAGLSARLEDDGVRISWLLQETPDFAAARIYRGDALSFAPRPENLVATVKAATWFDATGSDVNYYVVELLDDAGNATKSAVVQPSLTGIDDAFAANVPDAFGLQQNYPNPFNPETRIDFAVPKTAFVQVQVFDILGRTVRTLTEQNYQAGYHKLTWDGRNDSGVYMPSGVYIYKLVSGSTVLQKKMTLTK